MSERIAPFASNVEPNILKEKLLALCPEIFQDGRLNVEALQTLLPDDIEDEEQQKELPLRASQRNEMPFKLPHCDRSSSRSFPDVIRAIPDGLLQPQDTDV